ncbi:hypothetical protein ACFGX4_00710 [Pasteurella multocida]
MAKKKPLGIRNNNPGNIEWGSPWQGLKAKTKNSGRFAEFESPVYGIRAIAVLLITYYDKRKSRDGSKIDTIKEVIERWAPPVENNSTAYAKAVSDLLGVTPTSKINMHTMPLSGLSCVVLSDMRMVAVRWITTIRGTRRMSSMRGYAVRVWLRKTVL